MCPRILSLLHITSRRTAGIPAHLAYPWQAGHPMHRIGAAVIDPQAFDKAWASSMPADSFTSSTVAKDTP